jgi:broad specificity phosphatase PhoE
VILYLVRHGQTAYNRDGLGLGRSDVPLTDAGIAQVAAIARRLERERVERVYSSPLGRALETARAIAGPHNVDVEVSEELLELDVGETEGLTFPDIRERYGEFLRVWSGDQGHLARMPGGESVADVDARLQPFLDELRSSSLEGAAVVSHNFVTRLLICRLVGLEPSAFRAVATDVGSISALRVDPRRTVVRYLNDTCHCPDLNVQPAAGSVAGRAHPAC